MKAWKRIAAVCCAVAMMGSILSVNAWAVDQSISLQVNGEEVALKDAAPEIKNGRTFIPVRAAFEALDASVEWDQAAKSVTAVKDDTTVVMMIGSTVAQVTENGQTRELDMKVAPYIKGGRTYVPMRFAAEALDCAVGWDGQTRTVIIVDVEALLDGATFNNLNGWLAAAAKAEQPENALTTGTMNLKLTAPNEKGVSQSYPLKVDFSSHATQTKQQVTMSTDFKDLANLFIGSMGDLSAAEKAEILKLCKASAEARVDLSTGKLYFTVDSPLLLDLTENAVGSGEIWYLLDVDELMEQSGMAGFDLTAYIKELQSKFSEDMTAEELLYTIFEAVELDDAARDYEAMKVAADVLCALLSDQAMTKSGNNYVVNWSMEDGGAALQLKLTYQTNGERLTGCTMNLTMDAGYGDPVTMTLQVKGSGSTATVSLNCAFGGGVKLDFTLSAKTVKATAEPETLPPAGAEVVDVMEAFGPSVLDEGGLAA